jgi:hypothetical protein
MAAQAGVVQRARVSDVSNPRLAVDVESKAVQSPRRPNRCGRNAGVAQLVEQRIRNAKVNSSIPFTGTNE